MDAQQIAGLLDAERLREQIDEFLDHHGQRHGVTTRRLETAPVDQERVAGTEERLEEEVSVETAAVVLLRPDRRERIPGRRPRRPREAVVVHADHRDDAERHRTHRLHRADGDGTRIGTIAAARQRERVAQHRADAGRVEFERGGGRDGCGIVVREPLLQRGRHAHALPAARLGQRAERVHDALEAPTPRLCGRRRREFLLQTLKMITDRGERTEAQRLIAPR